MNTLRSRTLRLSFSFSVILVFGGCLTSVSEPLTDDAAANSDGNNRAPTISGNPSPAAMTGQVYTYVPTASDPDGDELLFSIQNQPQWADFDTVTGELSGQPTLGDIRTFTDIRITVSDGQLSSSLPDFDLTVTQSSLGSTTLTLIAPSQNTDGTPVTDLAAYRIYFGMTPGNYPNQIYIDNPSISTYVVENLAPTTYYFVATAFNQAGIESGFSNEVSRIVE